ncbi:hypothetical protein OESDEN_01767 [Oesophagostomum dentatum]|uniref:Fibronectin type-III domain-containing protein n=1 Tax=Oesophagostomum dentatum TaxID=61180 RepID=A0A0B1TS82_OESDE|nr:hypothetical protein OESDEN_01767 [Oesophagostomum dentatum]
MAPSVSILETSQVTDGSSSATFAVDVRKAYTFKVAAATMKGTGPFSPVLTINPDPAVVYRLFSVLAVSECSNQILKKIKLLAHQPVQLV